MLPHQTKCKLVTLLLGFIITLTYGVAHAYPVPELPEDNLIVNPWFRSVSDPSSPGFDGWTRQLTDGVTWGLSQKESNPSPDLVISGVCGFEQVYCGTAARWAELGGVLYPYIDVYAYQVVAANPSHRKLKFSSYYVSHIVEVGAVSIYGGTTPEGPWELIWVPLYHSQWEIIVPESGEVRDLWEETGFVEWNFDQGFPYYKIELQARLPESPIPDGIRGVGFKITGVYFSTTFTDEPGEPAPTPNSTGFPTPTPRATAVIMEDTSATPNVITSDPPPDVTRVDAAEPESNVQEVITLTAEAISPTEIILVWNVNQNNSRGLRVERSLNNPTNWQPVTTLEPNVIEFTNSGLSPDTVYYYRLRASQDQTSNVVSAKTLALPESPLAAPFSLQAVSKLPLQVELKWNDLSDDVAGYVVERSFDGQTFTTIETLYRDTTSFVDRDLEASIYYYRVRSFRNDVFSDYSEVVSVKASDTNLETDGEVATQEEINQVASQEVSEQSSDENPSNPILLIALAVIFGIGLGAGLARRRS